MATQVFTDGLPKDFTEKQIEAVNRALSGRLKLI
jgi:hypothetical protein